MRVGVFFWNKEFFCAANFRSKRQLSDRIVQTSERRSLVVQLAEAAYRPINRANRPLVLNSRIPSARSELYSGDTFSWTGHVVSVAPTNDLDIADQFGRVAAVASRRALVP
jgi:hypothetical protein